MVTGLAVGRGRLPPAAVLALAVLAKVVLSQLCRRCVAMERGG